MKLPSLPHPKVSTLRRIEVAFHVACVAVLGTSGISALMGDHTLATTIFGVGFVPTFVVSVTSGILRERKEHAVEVAGLRAEIDRLRLVGSCAVAL